MSSVPINIQIPTSAAYRATREPVEPGSPKHQQLIDAYRERATTEPTYEGMADLAAGLREPSEIGEMYRMQFAVQPPFPESVEGPAWATEHDDVGCNFDGHPGRVWIRKLAKNDLFEASLSCDDTYNDDDDTVARSEAIVQAWFGNSDAVEFTAPADLRAAAEQLLAAACELEAALSTPVGN